MKRVRPITILIASVLALAAYAIPMMANPGVKELKNRPWIGTLDTFKEYRLKGAPIGFAPE